MAMSAATLSTQLQNLAPDMSEAVAIQNLVDGWAAYFAQSAAGVPYTPNAAHKSAMSAALVGMSAPGAGAAKIQAGIVAWWTSVVATGPATYAGCLAVTAPPTIATIAAGLAPVFAANTSGSLSKAASCDAIAAVVHPLNLDGIATFPPAVATPIV